MKYSDYVYKIPKDVSGKNLPFVEPRIVFAGNKSMPGSNMNMDFTAITKETVCGFPHFHHAVEEYYMFSGTDLTNFFDFDAEIEIWIGEEADEMEKFVITKPTLVRIPANHWHGPINYKRVGKPVAFSSIYFSGDLSMVSRRITNDEKVIYTYFSADLENRDFGDTLYANAPKYAKDWAQEIINEEPNPHTGKYDKLIFEYPQEYHNYGDTYANPRGKFRGITQMPDVRFYGGFSVAMKDVDMEIPHVHHALDEYLWFIGANLEDISDWDAEIELDLGWDRDHMETLTLTEPCVVRVPPNMWHTPIKFKNVKKPVAFFPVYPDGDWSKVVDSTGEDGELEFHFEAAHLRKCAYNPGKICNYCGRCLREGRPEIGVFAYKKKGGNNK